MTAPPARSPNIPRRPITLRFLGCLDLRWFADIFVQPRFVIGAQVRSSFDSASTGLTFIFSSTAGSTSWDYGDRITVPAFARLEGTFGQSLALVQKAIVSERPADVLRGAQPGEQIGFDLAGQEVGETVPDRRQRGDAVESFSALSP